MANLYARATAAWASANWNTAADGSGSSATPGAGDTCYANSYTVTIDANVTVTAVVASSNTDGFILNNGVTLTANVVGASSGTGGDSNACVKLATGASATVVGNITGTGTNAGIQNPSTGTLTIQGDITGGSSTYGFGTYIKGGTLSLTGNAVGASYHTIRLTSTSALSMTGNVTGPSANAINCIDSQNSGSLSISGTVTGGSGTDAIGVNLGSSGSLQLTGDVVGGSHTRGTGIRTTNTGTVQITGYLIYNTTALGAPFSGTKLVGVAGTKFRTATSGGTQDYQVGGGGSIPLYADMTGGM